MAIQIALACTPSTVEELKQLGFQRLTIFVRQGAVLDAPRETIEAGNTALFELMRQKPLVIHMFVTISTGLQLLLDWDPKFSERLAQEGFCLREVYVLPLSGGSTQEQVAAGDAAFREMKHPPTQWVTTSWWARGPD